MSMKIFLYCLPVLFVLFSFCEKGNNVFDKDESQTHTSIKINPSNAKEINYSEIFNNIEYIPIPSDSNFMIGSIDKLCISGNYFFLMDKYITRSVFMFDINGKEKIQLHKQGQGPGEYAFLKDFYYDSDLQAIGIHCSMLKKILYYNIQGKYLSEKSLPFHTTRILPISNKYICYADFMYQRGTGQNGRSPNIVLTSPNGQIAASANFFKKGIDQSVVFSSNPDFSRLEEGVVSIKPDHCNIIYHATADSIFPAYKLDFGKHSLDSRYWKETEKAGATVEKVTEFCDREGICESFFMQENLDYLFFKYRYNGKVNSVFFSKKTGKIIHAGYMRNDMDQITGFNPKLFHENKFYCILNVENIFMLRTYLKENKYLPKRLLDDMTEFDNPIIAVFTLKEF